ncbi:MAG: pyridoxamine 5'-phosphate oxidase family protein [Gaiellaceae bacterium]
MSWSALPPEVARADLLGFAYLATLRADGRPRISPVEAHVWEGELLIGVMPRSLKARDLARDPRCTLQSLVGDPDSGEPELKLYCRAVEAEGEPPGAWWTGRPAADVRVYALEVEEAALVEWDVERGLMTVTSWSPASGARTATRAYP